MGRSPSDQPNVDLVCSEKNREPPLKKSFLAYSHNLSYKSSIAHGVGRLVGHLCDCWQGFLVPDRCATSCRTTGCHIICTCSSRTDFGGHKGPKLKY